MLYGELNGLQPYSMSLKALDKRVGDSRFMLAIVHDSNYFNLSITRPHHRVHQDRQCVREGA